VVPAVQWSATSGGVLVMERVDGVRIDDLAALQRRGQDRSALARLSAELLRQVFVAGFFHADPHPGNLLVLEDGRLALVDFGMVGRLDDDQRRAFVVLLLATVHQDPAAMTRGWSGWGSCARPERGRRCGATWNGCWTAATD
jgi:ubiquinone biosynthesis protein